MPKSSASTEKWLKISGLCNLVRSRVSLPKVVLPQKSGWKSVVYAIWYKAGFPCQKVVLPQKSGWKSVVYAIWYKAGFRCQKVVLPQKSGWKSVVYAIWYEAGFQMPESSASTEKWLKISGLCNLVQSRVSLPKSSASTEKWLKISGLCNLVWSRVSLPKSSASTEKWLKISGLCNLVRSKVSLPKVVLPQLILLAGKPCFITNCINHWLSASFLWEHYFLAFETLLHTELHKALTGIHLAVGVLLLARKPCFVPNCINTDFQPLFCGSTTFWHLKPCFILNCIKRWQAST